MYGILYVKLTLHYIFKGGVKIKSRITELRKSLGLTQQEAADRLGVSRQTIISLENGRYNPSIQLAYKISKLFGRTIEEVFIFDDEDLL